MRNLDLVSTFLYVPSKARYRLGLTYGITVYYNSALVGEITASKSTLKDEKKLRKKIIKEFALNDTFKDEEFSIKSRHTFTEIYQEISRSESGVRFRYHNDGFSKESNPDEVYVGVDVYLTTKQLQEELGLLHLLYLARDNSGWLLTQIYHNSEWINNLLLNEESNTELEKKILTLYKDLEYKLRVFKLPSSKCNGLLACKRLISGTPAGVLL